MADGLFCCLVPAGKGPIWLTRSYLAKLFFRCQPILHRRPTCCLLKMTAIEVALRLRLFYPGQVRREGTDQEQVGTRAAGPSGHLDPGRPSFSAARRISILESTPENQRHRFISRWRIDRRVGAEWSLLRPGRPWWGFRRYFLPARAVRPARHGDRIRRGEAPVSA